MNGQAITEFKGQNIKISWCAKRSGIAAQKWLKKFWCSCHRLLRITHPIILQLKLSISPHRPHYLPAESRADINNPPLPPLKLNGALRLGWWASLMPDLLASQLYIYLCQRRLVTLLPWWMSSCEVQSVFIIYLFYGVLPACAKKITRGRFFCTTIFLDDKTDLSQLLNNYTNWLCKHC